MDGAPINPILDYIQKLPATKKGLPHGQPVCVLTSHTITTSEALVRLAAELGPHIAVLQVQADIIDDWTQDTIDQLTFYSKKYGFILWEASRVLNATVNFMGRATASKETRKVLAELIKRKYTNGPIRTAQWSGLASSWAPGVPYDHQEKDLLIPTLRQAARESVATTAKTIQTEISVDEDRDTLEEEEVTMSPPTTNGWHEFSPDNLGYTLRKSSTISVTESVTLQPHVEPEDGVPPPPLLARGMSLCLPCLTDTAFTTEFRQSTIAAACANSDFVVGFVTSEPFFPNYRGNSLLELAFEDGHGDTNTKGTNLLASSPYLEQQNTLALFSLVPPEIIHGYDTDPMHTLNGDSLQDQSPNIAKLHYLMDRALKMRDTNRKEHGAVHGEAPPTGPTILQVPIVLIP